MLNHIVLPCSAAVTSTLCKAVVPCQIIIQAFITRTMSANILNLRRKFQDRRPSVLIFFYFRRDSITKWNKIILKNFKMFYCFILTWNNPHLKWNKKGLAWATNGSGSGVKFFKIIYFNMEPRLKWNKNVLTAKMILFHFRRDAWNETKLF